MFFVDNVALIFTRDLIYVKNMRYWDTEVSRWKLLEQTRKNREENNSFLIHFENKNICLKKIIKFTLNCVIIEVYKAECIITYFRKGQINEFVDLWHFIQQ